MGFLPEDPHPGSYGPSGSRRPRATETVVRSIEGQGAHHAPTSPHRALALAALAAVLAGGCRAGDVDERDAAEDVRAAARA